jgi:hypothetical protein
MSSNWKTFIAPLEGGLVLSKPHLQLSRENPGAAIFLENLEPDIKVKGYSKIKGYTKFSESVVPDGGDPTSTIKGVYAIDGSTVAVNRNREIYTSTGLDWTIRTASSFSNESVKMRGVTYRFTGSEKTMFVDGANDPYFMDHSSLAITGLSSTPSEVTASTIVESFAQRLWFAKDNFLTYTAPNTDTDFNTSNGAGVINVGFTITGLKTFRNELIIFGKNGIKKIAGNTTANFTLEDVSKSIGCLHEDTIQEVYGDLVYLGPNGIAFLSDSDRSGSFTFSNASKNILSSFKDIAIQYNEFSSVVIPSKNQYRIFFYDNGRQQKFSYGYGGVQGDQQGQENFQWYFLKGFKVFSCSYIVENLFEDFIVFSNDTDYVYQMESGTSFDSQNIDWGYWSPYIYFDDPILRKTIHNVFFYGSLNQKVTGSLTLKIDFDDPRIIQPNTTEQEIGDFLEHGSAYSFGVYGESIYGGNSLERFYYTANGAGHVFSFRLYGSGADESFNLNTLAIEYKLDGRY